MDHVNRGGGRRRRPRRFTQPYQGEDAAVLKKTLLLLTAAALLVSCLASISLAADAAALVKQGDEAWAQRMDVAKAQEAANLYEQALAADPKCYEAAWKMARALYRVGDKSPEDAQEVIFEKAVNAAKKATEISPDDPMGHYWLGVAYGKYGSAKGISKSLSLVDPIKEEMNFVISKDPKFEQGGPQRVLGRLYFKLPGLFGGDNDKAIEYLQEAVKIGPTYYLNQVYLAEALADDGQKDKAKVMLQEVLTAQAPEGMAPEMADWQAEAQKVLDDM